MAIKMSRPKIRHNRGFSRSISSSPSPWWRAWRYGSSSPTPGNAGRIAMCAAILKVLGQALHADARDRGNQLVPGGIDVGNYKASWDAELFPYLRPGLADEQLMAAVAPQFHCPSDTFERGVHPRSYAFSARDMTMGWQAGPNDKTGVGVWWDHRTVAAALGGAAAESYQTQPETLPRLPLSVVMSPARTLMLSDCCAGQCRGPCRVGPHLWRGRTDLRSEDHCPLRGRAQSISQRQVQLSHDRRPR